MSSNFSIHVKEAVLVRPSEQTPVQVLPLSALDSQPFLRFTIEYLLVYKTGRDLDRAKLSGRVKDALGRALVPYYPLTGRVRARAAADGGLEVVCRGQGAVFVEAAAPELTVADFSQAPPCGGAWRKLLSLYVADVLMGAPPVVVQLTWLSDNAATLAVGFNHCLCDGIGSAEFLNFVAHLAAAGETAAAKPRKSAAAWDRHVLNPTPLKRSRVNRVDSLSHPEFGRVADVSNFQSRFDGRLAPTSVTFYKRDLNELKKTVRLSEFESPLTSFEVLSAHVWRSWARSLKLPSNQTVKLLFSVNVRHRVKPSLPSGYYGNAFVLGCALTSVKDLTEKGLGYATELVKRAKERVDDEYVKEVIESVSSTRASPDSVGVLIMSQWSRLGLENVDFGMGPPVEVGPVICDRYCILLPVYNSRDAVKVNLAVPATAVDQYLYLLRNGIMTS